MTWTEIATGHVGHRMILLDTRTLNCVDCTRKLLLPKDPGGAATPTPNAYRRPETPGVPMPTGWKDRVAAEIRARKAAKQAQP